MEEQTTKFVATSSPSPVGANGEHHFVAALSPAMRAVERTMGDIAGTDIPVLVIGESGTGKGAVAHRIHQLSRRQAQAFVKVNCAALAPDFFNGGARPGDERPKSLWTSSGTVFLDEIGELEPICQPKLLYALPDGEIDEPGVRGARLITATRRNLEKEVRDGHFREDLYYRICGVSLRLPPLRQRKEDIPALLEHFLVRYAVLLGRPKPDISSAAMRTLVDHAWPGNIRELEYTVQKMIALGDERAALADLRSPRKGAASETGEPLSLKQAARAASRQAERELILKVLARTRWNRKKAAEELQISYKALLYKMKQVGLDSTGS